MKKLINVSIFIGLVLIIVGCDDVFEEDITNNNMTIISPQDKNIIEGNLVQFRWESIEGTEKYRIQVIDESLKSISLDSLVTGNNFAFNLNPGNYNWSVRGENFAYHTAYTSPTSFSMIASDNLFIQLVFLRSPSQNFYTNKKTFILTWDNIQAATMYSLEVDKTINGITTTELVVGDLNVNSYSLNSSILTEDAMYVWKIKAMNENSETLFSTRNIFIDTQIPNKSILTTPVNNGTISFATDFIWNIENDSGEVQSPLSSILEIAKDVNFTDKILTKSTSLTSEQYVFSSKGDYYWRVKITDTAGNESVLNEIRKITVQ